MTREWEIEYYKSVSDKYPVKDFVDNLDIISKAKVYNTFELLSEFGIRVGAKLVKKISGTKLWELRVLGEKSIRIFYIAKTGKKFLLLHAFVKKSQKTPKREIKTALSRLSE